MLHPLARPAFLLLAAAVLSAPLAAQVPVQVADLNTTRYDSGDSFLFGSEFVELSGTVYFTASDILHGLELWKTDGTEAGTVLLTDLCPGSCDSFPRNMTVVGTSIYFSADDGAHGFEPWITDGTAAGTRMIRDAVPGLGSSFPNFFRVLGGRVFYSARDPQAGTELWVTDGTAGGTGRLVDIEPGPADSSATPWQTIGSDLFFAAFDSVHGQELWATDGTAAGTRLVLDIQPGANSSLTGSVPVPGPALFGVLGSRLFFAANDGTAGSELWASDGTAAGTTRVADIDAGADGSQPLDFARLGTKLFFRARDAAHGGELWTTDGTAAGTALVADIRPGPDFATPFELVPFGGAVYFHADDGVHGRELWRSDGTEPGTTMVADIRTGGGSGLEFFLSPHGLTPVGSRLLFFADDEVSGNELWATDGTPAGTVQVADLNPGANLADAGSFNGGREVRVVSGGRWFFRAFDGPFGEGRQLYTSDGTAAGTGRVKRLVEQRSGVTPPFFGRSMDFSPTAALANRLIFSGDDGVQGSEPAASDGTPAGTGLLADVNPGFDTSSPNGMISLGGKVLFRASNGTTNDLSLWATDGTPGGTVPLAVGSQPNFLTAFLGSAYLSAVDAAHGTEVWKSDGTPGGTGLAFDLVPGTGSSDPALFTPLGNKLFFTAADPAAGDELWVTDGASAHRVADIGPGNASGFPAQLTASPTSGFGPSVYFSADDGTNGRELWVSDGTAAGTHLAADVRPGPGSSMEPSPVDSFASASGSSMVAFPLSGPVGFVADDGVSGEELWVSGASATYRRGDLFPGPGSSQPRQLTRVGRKIAFVADDGVHGRELWIAGQLVSDELFVIDISPGPASSVPQHLTGFGGIVLFSADDGVQGREPWVTDGTPQGTRRLADIAPGALPSSPYDFTAVGGDLYFAASDAVSGFELWRMPRAALGARIGATKRVSGQFVVGGLITYTIVLSNTGLGAQLRTAGFQLEDPIPASLSFESVSATSGIPVVVSGTGTQVDWVGEIPAGGQVTITINCRVRPGTAPDTVIANQATVHFDSDADLIDDTNVTTDDPGQPGANDSTGFRVGLGYYTLPPCRAFDSRTGSPLLNGFTQTVPLVGVCAIPATAKAVAFNVTAITPGGSGFLHAYPSGTVPGTVSEVNFNPGQTRTNNGILQIGADGKIVVAAALTGGAVDFALDVVGYFE
ncbi:MAG TPA: ELWxxDGT repeat protein [Thermoanaerobaculia bacterium]|jgi:uncharacterized repeat protein (TIGR01451 family)|nr:ELWxxDGT repeat protein [Thermoanaerobaculia bacterium]